MSDVGRPEGDGRPSPAELARGTGLEPSEGPSGDASIDALLAGLAAEVDRFAQAGDEGAGDSVLASAASLHARLQERLDEAAG